MPPSDATAAARFHAGGLSHPLTSGKPSSQRAGNNRLLPSIFGAVHSPLSSSETHDGVNSHPGTVTVSDWSVMRARCRPPANVADDAPLPLTPLSVAGRRLLRGGGTALSCAPPTGRVALVSGSGEHHPVFRAVGKEGLQALIDKGG